MNASAATPLDVKLMNTTAAVLFLAFAGLALLAAGRWVSRLPAFDLQGISVSGDMNHNNPLTLRANVAPSLSGTFFTVDLARVRSAFESVPWVRRAVVRREFPNRLRVNLQEHQAVAYWGFDAESRLINSYGEVFEANVSDLDDDKMPRLSGPDSQSQHVLAMYLALAPAFKDMALALDSLALTDRGSWRAKLTQGAVIELGRGSVEDVMARIRSA